MKPEPLFLAVESIRTDKSLTILLSPSGLPFKQKDAEEIVSSNERLIMICGHYEGVDERVIDSIVDIEFSIGDYVLTNGALASAVISDAIIRLIPGVLGAGEKGIKDESFSTGKLDYPQYTKPVKFRNMEVPDILLSGNHEKIRSWREQKMLERTKNRRID